MESGSVLSEPVNISLYSNNKSKFSIISKGTSEKNKSMVSYYLIVFHSVMKRSVNDSKKL